MFRYGRSTFFVADSAETTGLKWVGYRGVSCYLSGTQSLTGNVRYILPFGNENWDTDGFHSTTTNNTRITIPSGLGGKYLFNGYVSMFTDNASLIFLYKNGSNIALGINNGETDRVVNTGGNTIYYTSSLVVEAVATDYFEMGVTSLSTNKDCVNAIFTMTYLGA